MFIFYFLLCQMQLLYLYLKLVQKRMDFEIGYIYSQNLKNFNFPPFWVCNRILSHISKAVSIHTLHCFKTSTPSATSPPSFSAKLRTVLLARIASLCIICTSNVCHAHNLNSLAIMGHDEHWSRLALQCGGQRPRA